MARRVADDESAESSVANEDIGAQAKDEVLDSEISCRGNGPCQIVSRCSIVEEVSRTTYPESGVLTKRLIPFEPRAIEASNQLPVRVRTGVSRI